MSEIKMAVDIDTFEFIWSDEQEELFNCLDNSNESIFLSGNAGTGKTTTVNRWLKTQGERVVILAPTGIAALNIGGQTIHSFFGLPPDTLNILDAPSFLDSKYTVDKLRACKCMLLDEISMVRLDIFEVMNRMFQYVKGNNLPFGGVRMILVGDLMQLPPVVKQGAESEYLEHIGSPKGWFFAGDAYKNLNPRRFFLTKSFRQKDPYFYALLNRVRSGDKKVVTEINRAVRPITEASDELRLCTTNSSVDMTNERKFLSLPGEKSTYVGQLVDKFPEKQAPLPVHLNLGVGARVMTIKNGTGYVNGSLGEIVKLDDDFVSVQLDQGGTVRVGLAEWVANEYKMEGGKLGKTTKGLYRQIPVRLAWAMTIHKSQGQGFDSAIVDFGRNAFVHGQAYVALSRLRSLEGMFLSRPMRPSDIIVDHEVLNFLESE